MNNNNATQQPPVAQPPQQAPDDGFNAIFGPLPSQPINSASTTFADKIAAIGKTKAPPAPTAPVDAGEIDAGGQKVIGGPAGQVLKAAGGAMQSGGNAILDDIKNNKYDNSGSLGALGTNVLNDLVTAGHISGDIAGTTGGLIGSLVSPFLPDSAKTAIGGVAKTINDKIAAIPGMTPDIQKGLGDVFNTVSLMGGAKAAPVVGEAVKAGAEGIAKGASKAVETVAGGLPTAEETAANTATKVAAKTAQEKDVFVKDLITPNQTAKDLTGAIKTGKVTEGGFNTARDVTKAIPNFDKIQESVSKVPGISEKNTLLENANAIHDEIGKTAENLIGQLKGKGSFTPAEFNKYMDGVKTSLGENPLITGDAEATAQKIINKFNSLVSGGEKGYTPEGLLQARKDLDSWMSSQKGSNIFDPKTETAVSTALRAIRQGGNDFLKNLPGVKKAGVDVGGMLDHQSNLYRAIENIAPKAAKEGSTGFEQMVKAHPMITHFVKHALPWAVPSAIAGYLSGKL